MDGTALAARTILVLEDEPLIALEIADLMRDAGAAVLHASYIRDALLLVEHPHLSAAILDFKVSDGDAGIVCERLNSRAIPFVVYSGFEDVDARCHAGIHLAKPASSVELVATITRLLS